VLKRLEKPLSGSTHWLDYSGTTAVSAILGGRANIAELTVQGASGGISGAALRLYDPAAGQWTLNYFNVANGRLTSPMTGAFSGERGVFFGEDTLAGRTILVRFVITRLAADTYRFEQAFSSDAGASWEVNWIATDTRESISPGRG
jgi:hypothetical protein